MPTIAGASQYLNASTLANLKQTAAQTPSILTETAVPDLLDVGRKALQIRGIGISSSARALNQRLFNNTADINKLLSLAAGPDADINGARLQIAALRSKLGFATQTANGDVVDGNGNIIDTEA